MQRRNQGSSRPNTSLGRHRPKTPRTMQVKVFKTNHHWQTLGLSTRVLSASSSLIRGTFQVARRSAEQQRRTCQFTSRVTTTLLDGGSANSPISKVRYQTCSPCWKQSVSIAEGDCPPTLGCGVVAPDYLAIQGSCELTKGRLTPRTDLSPAFTAAQCPRRACTPSGPAIGIVQSYREKS